VAELPEDCLVRTWVHEKVAKDRKGGDDFVLRLYSAASAPVFWEYIARLKDGERHVYELIQDGVPCHIYFDLEFSKALNPGLDGDGMVVKLLDITKSIIRCVSLRTLQRTDHRGFTAAASPCSASNLKQCALLAYS
jgi:hypothetical protein